MVAPLISIVLPNLRPGGAEHLHVVLATEWLVRGVSVEFVLLEQRGELLAALPLGASVRSLEAPRLRQAVVPLCRYLRERKPAAVVSAMWPLTAIVPLAARAVGFKGRVLVSEHEPLSLAYATRGRVHAAALRSTIVAGYRAATSLVGVSSGVADDMARLSGMARSRVVVIHNPAATGRVAADGYRRPPFLKDLTGPIVLSVGTLKPVKRHDLLIHAFARLQKREAVLVILGEGQERESLEALVESLGLQGRVLLPGYVRETAPWYRHADLFVLASDHEGFGNVIVEALEHGLPVVSTDCPAGPREILEDGRYGALVPVGDAESLSTAMERALTGEHDRGELMRRAQHFCVDRAADAYLNLILPGSGEKQYS